MAGSGTYAGTDGIGTSASFQGMYDIAISSDSTVALVVGTASPSIRRIDLATGAVSTLVIASSRTSLRIALASDASFALVVDEYVSAIRRLEMTNMTWSWLTSTSPVSGGYTDGACASATFYKIGGVAVSADRTFALLTDYSNVANTIRRIDLGACIVSTLAGYSGCNPSYEPCFADGAGTSAKFGLPFDVAISSDASFALVVDSGNFRVRRVLIATGVVDTLAGSSQGYSDGVGTQAWFYRPVRIVISPDSAYALCSDGGYRLRRIVIATGLVTTVAGSAASSVGTSGFVDGIGTRARFNGIEGMSIAPNGAFALAVDRSNYRVRRIALASPCQAGYYCPAGSSSTTQFSCSAGFFCSTTGLSSSASQLPCNISGYACPAASTSAKQVACGIGYFCNATGLTDVASQVACNVSGYHCPAASTSATQVACTAGYACSVGAFNARGALDGQGTVA